MATANLNPVSGSFVNIVSASGVTNVSANDGTLTLYGGSRTTPTQHQYGFGGIDNTPTNSITQVIGDGTIAAGTSNQTFTIELALIDENDALSANPNNGQNVSYQILLVNTSTSDTSVLLTDTSTFATGSGNTSVTQVINWDTSQFPPNSGALNPDANNLEVRIVQSGGQPGARARKRFIALDFVQWTVEANDPLLTVKSQAIWV